ncbi:hypothetical protein QTP86_008103 [Hemibagrus guttatus]|nr:hypothetical protein QTP86_008103 [Hemibagrus guttatus]
MDRDEIKTHTGKEFLVMDLPVSMDQGNSWKDSSLAYEGDQKVADGQADLLSESFCQECNDTSLSNTATAESHRSGDLSDCITKQIAEGLPDKVMQDDNTTNNTKEGNDTLWSTLNEPAIINTNEFAELFAKMASPTKRKPLSEAYDKTAKAKKIIKVLDSKRSQAVGILISSLHLEMKDIQQAILMMDNSVVDLDAIEALYENSAQPEELAKIRKHYETSDEEHVRLLDKPEQFLYELSLIPQFSLRARCIILQSTFTDTVASIQRKSDMVLHVCKKRPATICNVFAKKPPQDNRICLMDYIVSYYLHNLDKNAGTENCVFPLPEPQDVFLASQVKFEDLSKELRKLGKDLEDCEKDVQRVWLSSPQEYIYPFKEKMETFISSGKLAVNTYNHTDSQKEKQATEDHLISAQKCFHDMVQYFGMKPRSGEQDVLQGHVFMLWFEFCNDFKTKWKKENKAISNER